MKGYVVKRSKTEEDKRYVYLRGQLIFVATLRPIEDYIDEVVNGGNECAVKIGSFTTEKGNRFMHWFDVEAQEDYLSRYKNEEN